MKPFVKEFSDDKALMEEVKAQSHKGISKDNLYVISHDDDRTDRVAENAGANTIGIKEEGLMNAVANIFKKKGDELRSKFKELGFSQLEANELEEKLDSGKILLIITPPGQAEHTGTAGMTGSTGTTGMSGNTGTTTGTTGVTGSTRHPGQI